MFLRTTRRHTPEDHSLDAHRRENLTATHAAGPIWGLSAVRARLRVHPKSDERLIVGLAVLPRIDRPLFILTLNLLRRVQ